MQNKNNKKNTQSSDVINSLLTVKPEIVHIDFTSKDKNLETPLESETVNFGDNFSEQVRKLRTLGVSAISIEQKVSDLIDGHKILIGKNGRIAIPSFFKDDKINPNIHISTKYDKLSLTPNITKHSINAGERFFDIGEKSFSVNLPIDGLTMEQMTQFVGEDNSIKKGGMTVISNEFLKTLSEKNETIITMENPIEIDIPNNIDDTNFSKETLDMLEEESQKWARKNSPLGFMTLDTAHNLIGKEEFAEIPTEKEFKAKAIQLKNTGNFKKLGHAQNALAVKYGFKDYNAIKICFAKMPTITGVDRKGNKIEFGFESRTLSTKDMERYKKAKILILNYLYTVPEGTPILVIVDEKVKALLESDFQNELKEIAKYSAEIAFSRSKDFGLKIFKICTKEESTKISKIILSNCTKYNINDDAFSITPRHIGRFDIVNIIGRVGSGKSTLLSKLNIDRKNTIIIDGKNGVTIRSEFKESKFIKFDFYNIEETLIALRNEFSSNEPRFLILDDLPFRDLFQNFPYFFRDFHKWAVNTTIIICSQEEFDKNINMGVKYLKINSQRDAENLKELIDYSISNNFL